MMEDNETTWIADDEFQSNGNMWQPEEGDMLVGTIQRIPTGKFGKKFLIVEDAEGVDWITTQCAQIDYKIDNMSLEEGDYVKLIYKGQSGENNAHNYKIFKRV